MGGRGARGGEKEEMEGGGRRQRGRGGEEWRGRRKVAEGYEV